MAAPPAVVPVSCPESADRRNARVLERGGAGTDATVAVRYSPPAQARHPEAQARVGVDGARDGTTPTLRVTRRRGSTIRPRAHPDACASRTKRDMPTFADSGRGVRRTRRREPRTSASPRGGLSTWALPFPPPRRHALRKGDQIEGGMFCIHASHRGHRARSCYPFCYRTCYHWTARDGNTRKGEGPRIGRIRIGQHALARRADNLKSVDGTHRDATPSAPGLGTGPIYSR